jgi:NAD-dependent deacetylase
MQDQIEHVAEWLRGTAAVTVLTGAGVSTDSGIPDFRGPNGFWTTNPDAEKLSDIRYFVSDPEIRKKAWRSRLDSGILDAKPNVTHLALGELERAGHLDTLVTQNIDGLHLLAGTSPERLVEIHGNTRQYMCLSCDDRGPIEVVLERIHAGDEDPHCRDCGGILKSATISFGQALVEADVARAAAAAERADVFLALGTSLTVYPAAGLPELAKRHGARLLIVNNEPTPLDEVADVVINASLTEVVPALVAAATS